MHQPSSASGGLTLINAQMAIGEFSTLRIVGSRIAALGADPGDGDRLIDLQGDRVLPGLINAHDHLQLNSLPRLDSGKQNNEFVQFTGRLQLAAETEPYGVEAILARDDNVLALTITGHTGGAFSMARRAFDFRDVFVRIGASVFCIRRVPGVSLETDTGEGRYINIRGLDADLNSTTFGGTHYFDPRQIYGEVRYRFHF